jgi:hypothetical protein
MAVLPMLDGVLQSKTPQFKIRMDADFEPACPAGALALFPKKVSGIARVSLSLLIKVLIGYIL